MVISWEYNQQNDVALSENVETALAISNPSILWRHMGASETGQIQQIDGILDLEWTNCGQVWMRSDQLGKDTTRSTWF